MASWIPSPISKDYPTPKNGNVRLVDPAHYSALPNPFAAHDKQSPVHMVEPMHDLDPNSDFNGSTSSTSSRFAWQSAPIDKLLVVCASIPPLLASTALLVTTLMDRSSTGPLLSFVLNNRATAQIVVSVVSAVLAASNVYTVTKLLNFATRIHLLRQSLSLKMIKFIGAVTTRSLVASLPGVLSTTSVIMVLPFANPNVLWTGALTPVLTNATVVEAGENPTVLPITPTSAVPTASAPQQALSTRNPYPDHSSSNLLYYNYSEPGYLTHTTCIHNATSDFHLQEIVPGKVGNGIPFTFYAIGLFPNTPPGNGADLFSVIGIGGDDSIATIAAKRYQGRNVILGAAGSKYPLLNSTQCEVTLTPTEFNIGVDVANGLITVLPAETTRSSSSSSSSSASSPSPPFDPTAGLATNAMNQINCLGMISTTLYTSIVGDALMSNINTTTTVDNKNNPASPAIAFTAMSDSFSAMVDDLFAFIASSQLFIPFDGSGDFDTVDVQLTVKAVRLGDAKYVFATFGMCVALLGVVLVEAWRTRVWRGLPRWNFMDPSCSVVASAVAGGDVLAEMCRDGGGDGRVRGRGRGRGRGTGRQMTMQWSGGGCGSKGQEDMLEVRLRLGRKVIRTIPAAAHHDQGRSGLGDWDGGYEDGPGIRRIRTRGTARCRVVVHER